MKIKKRITLITFFFSVLIFTNIFVPSMAENRYVIAYTGVNPRIFFWKNIQNSIKQYSRMNNILLLDYTKHDFSSERQIKDIQKAVEQNVDLLIVGATSDRISSALDIAIQKGIPVMTLDVNLKHPKIKCHIGTNNYLDTKKIGKFLINKLQKKNILSGDVIIVTGDNNNENAHLRANALKDVLEPYGYKVHVFFSKGWKTSTALEHFIREFSRKDISYDAAFATYADATVALAESSLTYSNKDMIKLGYGYSRRIKNYINENKIDAIIEQDAYGIGKKAIEMVPAIINNKIKNKKIDISSHMHISKKE